MTTLPKIVTCFPIEPSQVEQIQDAVGNQFDVVASNQEQIGKELFGAEIFFGHAKTPVEWADVIKQKKLKWIQSSAAGLDHCLTPEVIDSDILVSGCSALFAKQVAETSMALLMGLIRSLPVFMEAKRNREYVRRPTNDLQGKTVGIVGLGGNGQQIAKTLRPMVEKIIATDRFPDYCRNAVNNGIVDRVYPADGLEEMLPQADVVIVTLPLSEGNENRIADQQFAAFKSGAFFINVGRGSVVDETSLIKYLENGHLAGAGIDVANPEPIKADNPLWEMDNVIITPHVGAQSEFRVPKTVDLFCENFSRYVAGETLINWVDKQLGYPHPKHRIQF
jgi:D-3-phosphoglycerate dehydrogenase